MQVLDQFEYEDHNKEEWAAFIVDQSNYYLQAWTRIKNGNFLIFNPYAFFFNIFWLLYRQMFKTLVLYLSFFFAEGYIEKVVLSSLNIHSMPSHWIYIRIFVFTLALGFLGNWFYLLHAEEIIKNIKKQYTQDQHLRLFELRGGTSFIPVLLFTVVVIMIILVNQIHAGEMLNPNYIIR